MTLRVAINGFGRIGRTVLRSAIAKKADITFVAINDIYDPATLVNLAKYDSVYGPAKYDIEYDGGQTCTIDGTTIELLQTADITELPWAKLEVDVVIEATGVNKTRESAQRHLTAGAQKVVITSPCADADAMVVLGVNHEELKKEHRIISNASCTTNCLAPMVKVLDDNFGIDSGLITTIHAYTATQRVVDSGHKDPRRARAAAINLIPTTTGAARTVGKVLRHLEGHLDGMAMRVPSPAGSATDLVANLKTSVTKEQINDVMRENARTSMADILAVCDDPIVSSDIIGRTESCIVDAELTMAMASNGGTLVKLIGWYDNEMGYSTRVVDLLELL